LLDELKDSANWENINPRRTFLTFFALDAGTTKKDNNNRNTHPIETSFSAAERNCGTKYPNEHPIKKIEI